MVTVLEECTTQEQHSVVHFFAKDIYKEKFPVYGGKCLSCKAVHKLGDKHFADDEEVETEVRKWLRQQSKGFYAAGCYMLVGTGVSMLVEDMLRHVGWDRCINVGGGYVETCWLGQVYQC
jgi:hypothetical protein